MPKQRATVNPEGNEMSKLTRFMKAVQKEVVGNNYIYHNLENTRPHAKEVIKTQPAPTGSSKFFVQDKTKLNNVAARKLQKFMASIRNNI
jgi:hypothetical protein